MKAEYVGVLLAVMCGLIVVALLLFPVVARETPPAAIHLLEGDEMIGEEMAQYRLEKDNGRSREEKIEAAISDLRKAICYLEQKFEEEVVKVRVRITMLEELLALPEETK